jgi:hypothetical protein
MRCAIYKIAATAVYITGVTNLDRISLDCKSETIYQR